MCFRVKINSNVELLNGLKELRKIGALGTQIGIGTCMDESISVDSIINNNMVLYKDPPCNKKDIMEFSIYIEDRQYALKEFPHLFGKNNIYISFTTYYDCVICHDVFDRIVPYSSMIKETLKLIGK